MDADDLLAQADRGLLLAKRTGKGRVAIAALDTDDELDRLTQRGRAAVAVQALVAAIETRDHYFQGHSDEVVRLATSVAMIMGSAGRRSSSGWATRRCCTTSASSRSRTRSSPRTAR